MIACIIASVRQEATATLQVKSRHCHACYLVPEGDKEWYLYAARAGLLVGVASHRSYVGLTRSPVAKAPTNRPAPPPPFSFIMARRRRWSAAMCSATITMAA